MIEATPKVLVVGAGHAGASVAAAAVRAGLQTTVWSRRPLVDLSPAFQVLCATQTNARTEPVTEPVQHQQVDWWKQIDLQSQLTDTQWLVLADEPRETAGNAQERAAQVDRAAQRYRMLEAVGFGQQGRSVVRIGSPAGEHPYPGFDAARELPYVRLKLELAQQATDAAARGLRLSTVAPAEIHSAYSTYASDPYRLALARFDTLPALHDVPVAAVSDESLGEAVLVAAAAAPAGGWYEAADGILGPGRALQLMASTLGRSPLPTLVEWLPEGAHHLFDVLHHGASVDLDRLLAGTEGWERELAPLVSLRDSQRAMAGAAVWWAGPKAQATARQAAEGAWATSLGSVARAVGQQVSAELLGVMLALGTQRNSTAIDQLAQQFRSEQPKLAARLLPLPVPTTVERARRLMAAVERQAARSSM